MTEPTGDPPISPERLSVLPPRRRPLWRTLLWIAGVIAVAVVVAVLLTPHGDSGGPGGPGGGHGGRGGAAGGGSGRRPPTVVGVATAALGDIPIQIDALGTVTPLSSVTVHTRIAGALMGVYFTEGQMVRAGQLLALVDPRPYQVALEQAEGQLMRDQAALDQARLDLARYRTLAAQDSIARQQVDTQAALVKQDAGIVKSDHGAVGAAKLNLIYCHITAPVSGRAGLRQVDPGNFVQTGDANGVVVINQVDPITVLFTVPEDDIPRINLRMMTSHTLPATAFDRTGTLKLGEGDLFTLDNQIDATTGTVKAKARFANPVGALFASQFVNVTVLVDTLRDVVTVPAVAIRHGPQGDFVYVVQLDSTVKMTPVKVGPSQGETASIASGLTVGDQVVTDGGDRLSDGSTVVLPQDAAAMAAKANRKPKPTDLVGWFQGLFAKKPAPGASGSAAGPAARGGGGTESGGGRRGRMMAIVGQLDLTPDQKAKAQQIFAAARASAAASDDPNARRTAMQGAMTQLEAILTPAQKAKLAQLRAAESGGGQAPPAPAPASPTPAPRPDQAASLPPTQAPPAAGRSSGGPGDRLAMLTGQLGLDADQQAKAAAIFAAARQKAGASAGPDARRAAIREAMGQLGAILRPDQKARLEAIRAARAGGGQ